MANAPLIEVTPGRLNYLDQVWDSYQAQFGRTMPIDIFSMHIYILPEVTEVDGVKEANDVASVALGTDPAMGTRA